MARSEVLVTGPTSRLARSVFGATRYTARCHDCGDEWPTSCYADALDWCEDHQCEPEDDGGWSWGDGG